MRSVVRGRAVGTMAVGGAAGSRQGPVLLRTALLALLWGSTFLWIALALEAFAPAQVTFLRCALGALVLTGACAVRRQRLPRGRALWGRAAVAALLCNAVPFTLFSLGQQTVDSGVAGVLNATTPLWALLVGLALGSERGMRPGRLLGLLTGFAGTLLIFAPWQQSGLTSWGAVAILGAALSYALAFAYMSRTLARTGTPTLPLAAAQLLAATGMTALALPYGGGDQLAPERVDFTALLAVLALGVLCTGVTFYLTFRVIAEEGATNAAGLGYLLPVVAVALGALVLGEPLGLRVVLGMAVVLAGLALLRARPRNAPASGLRSGRNSPPAQQRPKARTRS